MAAAALAQSRPKNAGNDNHRRHSDRLHATGVEPTQIGSAGSPQLRAAERNDGYNSDDRHSPECTPGESHCQPMRGARGNTDVARLRWPKQVLIKKEPLSS